MNGLCPQTYGNGTENFNIPKDKVLSFLVRETFWLQMICKLHPLQEPSPDRSQESSQSEASRTPTYTLNLTLVPGEQLLLTDRQ